MAFNIMQSIRARHAEKARLLKEAIEDKIILAEQVKNFFNTDVGQYIETKINDDIATIKDKLVFAKADEIVALQQEFKLINRIKQYLGRAILEGQNAEKALFTQSNEEEENT